VSKVVVIKTSHLPERSTSHKETGAGCPESFYGSIILTSVFFQRIKNSAATKRISKFVNIAARSAGVFKGSPLVKIKNLWLAGCDLFVLFH